MRVGGIEDLRSQPVAHARLSIFFLFALPPRVLQLLDLLQQLLDRDLAVVDSVEVVEAPALYRQAAVSAVGPVLQRQVSEHLEVRAPGVHDRVDVALPHLHLVHTAHVHAQPAQVHVADVLYAAVAEEALDHPCLADQVGGTGAVGVEELVERTRRLAQHEIHVVQRVCEQGAELRAVLGHALQHDEGVVCRKLGDDVHGIYAHVRDAHGAGVDSAYDVLPQEDVDEHGLCDGGLGLGEHGLPCHARVVAVIPGVDDKRAARLVALGIFLLHAPPPQAFAEVLVHVVHRVRHAARSGLVIVVFAHRLRPVLHALHAALAADEGLRVLRADARP